MDSVETEDVQQVKELYPYQKQAIENIFDKLQEMGPDHNLLFQLPTGGGKTIIFSEITKRFLESGDKKVLILTHRIELCSQTAGVLRGLGIKTKTISSEVKNLEDQSEFPCFVAMVETLNNRLSDDEDYLKNIGLVIVDEAHYNSFRKIFRYFSDVNILGVTATPLSSNKALPLNDNYDQLIVGESIADLISNNFLAKADTYTFSVNLRGLKVGISGDFTVSSSERLYSNYVMQDRLLAAYEEKSMGKKTLIFNSGIITSRKVFELFTRAGYPIKHLDSTFSESERRQTLEWFRKTKNGILTSVGILTTGFDEPTVETIILNRATRSLTLFHQMIGRGSRILPNKKDFTLIDLGNNALRLGLWEDYIDWQDVFKFPDRFLEKIANEEEFEYAEEYEMPPNIARHFTNTTAENLNFDIRAVYAEMINNGRRPQGAIDESIENHLAIVTDNAETIWDAQELLELLQEEIEHRLKQYQTCITKSTDSYFRWVCENYHRKLKYKIRDSFDD